MRIPLNVIVELMFESCGIPCHIFCQLRKIMCPQFTLNKLILKVIILKGHLDKFSEISEEIYKLTAKIESLGDPNAEQSTPSTTIRDPIMVKTKGACRKKIFG